MSDHCFQSADIFSSQCQNRMHLYSPTTWIHASCWTTYKFQSSLRWRKLKVCLFEFYWCKEVSFFLPLSQVCCMAAVQAPWLQCSPLIQNATHYSNFMFHNLIWTIQNGYKLGTIWSTCPFTLSVCPVWLVGKEHKEDRYFTQAAEIFVYGKYKRS